MPNEIGLTIYNQLGGSRFAAMTGYKNGLSIPNGLLFLLPSRFAKDGINKVRITLNGRDLYDMEFIKVGPQPSFKGLMAGKEQKITVVATRSDVFCDQLQSVFTSITGLDTHL